MIVTFPDICPNPAKLRVDATAAIFKVAMAPIQQGDAGTVTIERPTNINWFYQPDGTFAWLSKAPVVTTADFNGAASTAAMVWAQASPPLPSSGNVTAGQVYTYNGDMWFVIQSFSRTTYPNPPATYPALIRLLRAPWRVYPWWQPIDQYDAWKLVNPLTGAPDECTHIGYHWRVQQADGAGNNVWIPGEFGWQNLGAE
jgi:hypothetical protein